MEVTIENVNVYIITDKEKEFDPYKFCDDVSNAIKVEIDKR